MLQSKLLAYWQARSAPGANAGRHKSGGTRTTTTGSICAAALLLIAGCGGGGGDDVAPPPPPPIGTTELQAKKLAARTINALFVADDIVSQLFADNFGDFGDANIDFGSKVLGCVSGSGTALIQDVDSSTTLSLNDRVDYLLASCQPHAGSPWLITGAPRIEVLAGVQMDAVWRHNAQGTLAFQVAANGVQFGPARYLAGVWATSLTVQVAGGSAYHVGTTIPRLTLALGGAGATLTDVAFDVRPPTLSGLAGSAQTTVAGLGTLTGTLSTPVALTLGTDTDTRYRPRAGTVRWVSSTLALEMDYGPGGSVKLRVDDGNNGSVELQVTTTVAELDALLDTL